MGEPDVLGKINAYPEIAAIAILILGFIAGRLLSLALGYVLVALDRRISRATTSESGLLTPRLISLSRAIAFWITLIFAVALALRVLGAGEVSLGINNAIVNFVPQALIAFAIVVVGHLLGVVASNLVVQLSENLADDSPAPRLLYGVIIAIAVVMALQHVGINITFVTRLLLIVVAVGGGGLMLAFANGARGHVANLLAHRELSRIAIGARIRIDGVEGTVVEIHSTAVDLATDEGITSVPAARFAELPVLRIPEGREDD